MRCSDEQSTELKNLFTAKNITIVVSVILLDFSIFLILGLLLMNYDDSYDVTKGVYWSLTSMNFWQKMSYLLLQFWYLINFIGIIYLLYRIVKHFRSLDNK
ncbi:MAG: hypothetical protein AB8B72_11765 [Crocinitomicaceae bacterium]